MSDAKFKKLLAEWKHRLCLDDWIISASLVETIGGELAGDCNSNFVNKTAVIRVLKKMPTDRVTVFPIEKVLIHELLHCKFMSITNDSVESQYYGEMQHQLLEDMAYALYSAKYGKERPNEQI